MNFAGGVTPPAIIIKEVIYKKEKIMKLIADTNIRKIQFEESFDGFIIPNTASHLSTYCVGRKELMELMVLNKIVGDPVMIQTWLATPLNDNVVDHLTTITLDGLVIVGRIMCGNIPHELLKDKREGDIVDVIFPFSINSITDEGGNSLPCETFDITVLGHVTLAQKKYRYKTFGTFEQVLERVCG